MKNGKLYFIILVLTIVLISSFGMNYNYDTDFSQIDKSDLVWMLISTAFVFIMTPGLVLFFTIFAISWLLYYIVNKILPMRVSLSKEIRGLDDSQHGEFFS